jgi:hypothetical protein
VVAIFGATVSEWADVSTQDGSVERREPHEGLAQTIEIRRCVGLRCNLGTVEDLPKAEDEAKPKNRKRGKAEDTAQLREEEQQLVT